MKKRNWLFRAIVIALFIIVSSQVTAEETFLMVDSMGAPPFKIADSEGKPSGVFYDIITRAFERMEVPLKYEGYPWKRAQMLVKTGKADALITVSTPERLEHLVPNKESVFVIKMKIYTQRDNLKSTKSSL